jgi:hypothetical protein
MNWTQTAPTKAGIVNWREYPQDQGIPSELEQVPGKGLMIFNRIFREGRLVCEVGGEWLPLFGGDVLAAEVEKAWKECVNTLHQLNGENVAVPWWTNSKARKVTTGEQEPSL